MKKSIITAVTIKLSPTMSSFNCILSSKNKLIETSFNMPLKPQTILGSELATSYNTYWVEGLKLDKIK